MESANKKAICNSPVFVIKPNLTKMHSKTMDITRPVIKDTIIDRIPKWQHTVYINSYTPVKDKTATGSHLTVIYWLDKMEITDIDWLVVECDWKHNAKDWWF